MTSALTKAFQDAQRSYAGAAFAVKQSPVTASNVIANSADGTPQRRQLSGNPQEQYRHFTSWVFAAIRPIAQRIASAQVNVGRITTRRMPGRKSLMLKQSLPLRFKSMGDRIEPLESHPVLDLLDDPNELGVAWSLMYTTVASLELTGQSFWWVTRFDGRRVIWPIPSHWVRGFEGNARYEAWYVQPPGLNEPFRVWGDEMVYFHYPAPHDPKAVFSPLQAAAEAVMTDEAIQASQWRAFERGINPKVVLTAGRLPELPGGSGPGERPVLTPVQRQQLVDAIKSAYSGSTRWEEPLIVDGLIERVETVGRSISEMDYLQSGQQTKARIFQVFGTNPIIAGEIDGANRAQATVAEEQFCSNTVNPKIELMSQVLTQWLGPMFAQPGERLVIWIECCRAHDPEQRLKEWSLGLSRHAITKNEYRRHILNLPDHPDGDELTPHFPSAPLVL